jgi:hypothetical protein
LQCRFQALDDSDMATLLRQAHRRRTLRVSLIRPGPRPQEDIDESELPVQRRPVKGGRTAGVRRVNIGAAIQQHRHTPGSVTEHGEMQRGASFVVGSRLKVGTRLVQKADDLTPFGTVTRRPRDREVERREAAQDGLEIKVLPVMQQTLESGQVAGRGDGMKR